MTFYKITELSDDFAARAEEWRDQNEPIPLQTEIQLWQARFMLAIAQQVSIVANHLGKIVKKASEPNG